MTDLKHSPGPWFMEAETYDSYYEISDDFGTALAKVEAWDGDNDEEVMGEAKANARLIANAPELLESLIELIAFVDDRGEWTEFEPFIKARAVIAKAKAA
jgi:hypothetical protein